MKKPRINPFLVAYLVALISLAVVGYYVADFEIKNVHEKSEEKFFSTDLAFYDLPRINLILSAYGPNKSGKVRMDISLEVAEKDMQRLKDYQPRIMDTLVNYMRQFDVDEVSPPKVMALLHENLLNEVNLASKPVPIRNIVFREFVVQ
jgi:flagellar basal body-associated protein FliL